MKWPGLKRVVIFGSGPIVIGQACEFDYSGTQACKALMAEGLEVILINSNPATIMTDPEVATRVYIEPLKAAYVEKILEKEKPDAVIPTLGGQTALNLALELESAGVFQRLGIRLLGANSKVIRAAEDREQFCRVLDSVGAKYPRSRMIRTYEAGMALVKDFGLPLVLRPNFTLGGGGGGIAYSMDEYQTKLAVALHESPSHEVLVEASILGWKEFELEVMRDRAGTFVVVCSIENLDPCGVHTGDSITVAPQQTLTDREYQAMRDEAQKIIEAVGVETGGANIQFAVNPKTGERVVIEMNPRVSRSSALASKATGFPIAKIAALLAIGYRLDELKNDITGTTPSCYEPALDYVVTKVPRFAFEKFSTVQDQLGTQMKSVGQVMGIGRTFQESLQKALLSLEGSSEAFPEVSFAEAELARPNSTRIFQLMQAFRDGVSLQRVHELTDIDPWFLEQIEDLYRFELDLKDSTVAGHLSSDQLLTAKRKGFSDASLARLAGSSEATIRDLRLKLGLRPHFYQVDTCAGEFKSSTPYLYSTYWGHPNWDDQRHALGLREKPVVLIGSGPNRIGQGIEFDYGCVRAVKRLRQMGRYVVVINSNPETVSTDYDTSHALFFEPVQLEHVAEVLSFIQPEGFIAQVGGQTPISLAPKLVAYGFKLLGSSLDSIDLAEDRGRFARVCEELHFRVPKSGLAHDEESAISVGRRVGFPLICRPSYVLGGRRMEIIESEDELKSYFERHKEHISPSRPCFVDEFLTGALEVDVDLAHGSGWCVVGGILEHIEAAGVHSGDSMAVFPPQRLKDEMAHRIEEMATALAERLDVQGLLNLQLAVKDDEVFILEANPRSSRSVPFLMKAAQIPLVDLGVMAMLGERPKAEDLSQMKWRQAEWVSVKGVVFPFKKLPEADSILGPEMKSTGETMGRSKDYAEALIKALVQTQHGLPQKGEVFLSLRDKDKTDLASYSLELHKLGFSFSATGGTAKYLNEIGIPCESLRKVHEGRPNCVDRIRSGRVVLVLNTTSGRTAIEASFGIRRSCIDYSIPCLTESDAVKAFLIALQRLKGKPSEVFALPGLFDLTH
jgi:carbamoyl-phosphate synthase large subunit